LVCLSPLPFLPQDAPNKKGLARALAKIIELRRASNTLQLLVITHDEEFVEELGRSLNDGGGSSSRAQLGTYFRVWREEVRPGTFHSRIEKQNFSA
jgi:DNA repair exonuclease SbcCD ATPase subunit